MIDPNTYRKSHYLKAADLTATRTKVRIAEAGEEQVGNPAEPKVVLQFTSASLKPMICNYTNLVTLVDALSPDEAVWRGKLIVLFKTRVLFQNRMVETIRIEIPAQDAAASSASAPVVPTADPPPIPEEILEADEDELI